ncbi:uncharacterized protein LOC113385812 [Ctenocephalides felis]|uniref:uncharacterized protein LOC113385812 n=1 Tax=Ctenocephalides felis TaxID=7515 RepID=UPI000E6E4A78|nr:uncharacterized protein LOC113385812 [Ctenocephalides felis]
MTGQKIKLTDMHINTIFTWLIIALHVPGILGSWSYQPNKVIEYSTTCTKDSMDILITMDSSFNGIIFAKDYPNACQANGTSDSVILLTLPTRGCGVRLEPEFENDNSKGRTIAASIIVQMDARLRQAADVEISLKCKLPSINDSWEESSLIYKDKAVTNKRTGRTERLSSLPLSSMASGWLELFGSAGTDYAEVGRNATLRVRVEANGHMQNIPVRGARVADCYASDGAPREITQLLIDRRGCPIDPLILPQLVLEEISTKNKKGKLSWSFIANFAAFKFPDRERVTIRCDVQLCNKECRQFDCSNDAFPEIDYIDKIEVFNSLHVEAPDIEENDARYFDVAVLPQRIRQDPILMVTKIQKRKPQAGTLCLSPQKLALSFCILGLIFLIAIIVALCSWFIRSRAKRQSHRRFSNLYACSRSGFSIGGSSTKLLVNTPDGSWPYGRVF